MKIRDFLFIIMHVYKAGEEMVVQIWMKKRIEEEELRAEINSAVRTEVSPVAALAGICAPHCCLDCVCRLLG